MGRKGDFYQVRMENVDLLGLIGVRNNTGDNRYASQLCLFYTKYPVPGCTAADQVL